MYSRHTCSINSLSCNYDLMSFAFYLGSCIPSQLNLPLNFHKILNYSRYKLRQPTKQYTLWCDTVLKTARLAVSVIAILKEQTRASKLSFAHVTKRVAEFKRGYHAFISKDATLVERYVVVHGQIILQQFTNYPDEYI